MNKDVIMNQIQMVFTIMNNLEKALEQAIEIQEQKSQRTLTYWLSLEKACELKGINHNTVKSTWWRQPAAGQPDEIINGRKHWKSETVEDWLPVGDRELINYVRGFGKEIPADARQQINDTCRKHGLVVDK